MPKIKKCWVQAKEGHNILYAKEFDLFVNSKGEFYARVDESFFMFAQEYLKNHSGLVTEYQAYKEVLDKYSRPKEVFSVYARDLSSLESVLKKMAEFAFSGKEEKFLALRYKEVLNGTYFVQSDGTISNKCCEKDCPDHLRECGGKKNNSDHRGKKGAISIGLDVGVVWMVVLTMSNGTKRVNYYPFEKFAHEDQEIVDCVLDLQKWNGSVKAFLPSGISEEYEGYGRDDNEHKFIPFDLDTAKWFSSQLQLIAVMNHNIRNMFKKDNVGLMVSGNVNSLMLGIGGSENELLEEQPDGSESDN